MNLNFDFSLKNNYHSASQIARVLTERWTSVNMFCPRCGNPQLTRFENNRPVADFYCSVCNNEYELKSKKGALGKKIADGAYETMIARISSNNNPDFFFMGYDESGVRDFMLIPKHFFVPDIIEKRNPLSDKARRAGWVGCNILIDKIPEQGKIIVISNGVVSNSEKIVEKVNRSYLLATEDITARGWLLDILNCINLIPARQFALSDVYEFEELLFSKHPSNNNIQAKIRQQLQILRDRGFIEFLGQGNYRKI